MVNSGWLQDQQWDEDAFYAWKYERPTSMWYYLGIGAIPVVVIAACLFPLAPWWARVALVYVLSGLLVLLMGVLVLRYTVFGIVWVLSGSSLWIFPNLMSDQTRAVTGCLCGAMLWLLASHSPDMAHLKDDAEKAHDWMVDYLKSMHGRNQTFLADNNTAGPAQQQPGGPGASSRQVPGAARSRGHRPGPNQS
ncbi:uncharacterized protein HaLaN_06976 [Haematococcus lacustris]|uniref:Translocation protein SEC62 n=1 Tax=Haematococcus lacustris TaxID=44745 RepID=A0A699YQF6_HAELA|nr:uncharacterized protein HaLaN_06976 [Haematococcus lacustris]